MHVMLVKISKSNCYNKTQGVDKFFKENDSLHRPDECSYKNNLTFWFSQDQSYSFFMYLYRIKQI